MNPILQIFTQLTDEELYSAINDIDKAEKSGAYEDDSIIRNLATKVAEINQQDVSMNLFITQVSVLREVSKRWQKQYAFTLIRKYSDS